MYEGQKEGRYMKKGRNKRKKIYMKEVRKDGNGRKEGRMDGKGRKDRKTEGRKADSI